MPGICDYLRLFLEFNPVGKPVVNNRFANFYHYLESGDVILRVVRQQQNERRVGMDGKAAAGEGYSGRRPMGT